MKAGIKKKRIRMIAAIAFFVTILSFGIYMAIMSQRMSQLQSMTVQEMIDYTTKNKSDVLITVGIIRGEEMSYTLYGENSTVLPQKEYVYEIGSVTKTFTCSLLCKAISEGRVELADSVDQYIPLPENHYYPSFAKLVTHSAGYKGYYFDQQMIINFLLGQENDYYGISTATLNTQIAAHPVKNRQYAFNYSNFGISVIGSALAQIYGKDYAAVMNDFIVSDLGLEHTKISDGTGNLSGYWNWEPNDGYMAAGAITSTIGDMLKYINLHMTEHIHYLAFGHEEVSKIQATSIQYEKMNIRLDAAGIGWMIDHENNIIWHNGGTSSFNSYVAFDREKQIGVVVLSNLSPNDRIPATVMGARLMIDLQGD